VSESIARTVRFPASAISAAPVAPQPTITAKSPSGSRPYGSASRISSRTMIAWTTA
jgi:hypothetical protein